MRKFALGLVVFRWSPCRRLAGKYNKAVSVGDKAPDFSGLPAVENGEDTSLTLADIKEDVVVLVFLGNHCPVVKAYEDRLIEFTRPTRTRA